MWQHRWRPRKMTVKNACACSFDKLSTSMRILYTTFISFATFRRHGARAYTVHQTYTVTQVMYSVFVLSSPPRLLRVRYSLIIVRPRTFVRCSSPIFKIIMQRMHSNWRRHRKIAKVNFTVTAGSLVSSLKNYIRSLLVDASSLSLSTSLPSTFHVFRVDSLYAHTPFAWMVLTLPQKVFCHL